jgi:hypothetical protein
MLSLALRSMNDHRNENLNNIVINNASHFDENFDINNDPYFDDIFGDIELGDNILELNFNNFDDLTTDIYSSFTQEALADDDSSAIVDMEKEETFLQDQSSTTNKLMANEKNTISFSDFINAVQQLLSNNPKASECADAFRKISFFLTYIEKSRQVNEIKSHLQKLQNDNSTPAYFYAAIKANKLYFFPQNLVAKAFDMSLSIFSNAWRKCYPIKWPSRKLIEHCRKLEIFLINNDHFYNLNDFSIVIKNIKEVETKLALAYNNCMSTKK